jgi:hypothetical protein
MSELDTNVLKNGQLAVATVAQSGEIISSGGELDATAVVQTDNGPQKCVKTFSVGGGGGGGGTDDYNDLSNKPHINGVTLSGNKSSADLHLQGATSIVTLTTTSTELATNTIYNGGELASVTLTLPATVPVDFIAQVEFTSGATATTFTAPASLYFNGDACEGGVFEPVANKRYCIMVISDGINTLGFVVEK